MISHFLSVKCCYFITINCLKSVSADYIQVVDFYHTVLQTKDIPLLNTISNVAAI